MNHRDQYISEVTIVVKAEYISRLNEIDKQLVEIGVEICTINEDIGTIEATCESSRTMVIERMEFVQAVRTTFSYIADFPEGDARDLDGKNSDRDLMGGSSEDSY